MPHKLIKKVAQKVTAEYCRLSIVENPDGFLTQEVVCSLLLNECGIEVVHGSNLQLRIHFELEYKSHPDKRYLYVTNSIGTLLADMKRNAIISDFSISDVFPLFADKTLIRQQSFEVLEALFEIASSKMVSMAEAATLVNTVKNEIDDRKRKSAEYFLAKLTAIEPDWNDTLNTIRPISEILSNAIYEGVYEEIEPGIAAINDSFQKWVDTDYFATLHSNAFRMAKSVNQILPHLSMNYDRESQVALVVIDGFTFWQYTILENHLSKYGLKINSGCTFAWMPSITMLSRQAIFRGRAPLQDYKQNPDNEKKLWFDYWKQSGFATSEIQYLYSTDDFYINEGVKRLAFVTVEMDDKMHSSTDCKDLHSLTENWAGRIVQQIVDIINKGFTIYLTSDHGSVLSKGWRALTQEEKVFLYKDGSRGARHLIYNNTDEQGNFYATNSDIQMLKHDNWLAIRNNRCLAKENTRMITHGGSHFLEMIVPFIQILK